MNNSLVSFALKYIPGFRIVASFIRLNIVKRRVSLQFRKVYQQALLRNDVIRLHIGAGPVLLTNWINTDVQLFPLSGSYYLDATKTFPIKDNSVTYIFNEDFIEHISLSEVIFFLNESYRVLKPEGVLRITTPDLRVYCKEYIEQSQYAYELLERNRVNNYEYGPSLAAILNKLFYADQHRCIFDRETLESMLLKIGFQSVASYKVRESPNPELRNLEQHDVGGLHDEVFTLSIEAIK